MFFVSHIWKQAVLRSLIAVIATLGLIVVPAAAHADGETYAWKDSQQTAIEASGGSYSQPTELKLQGQPSGDATFSGPVSFTCDNGTNNGTVQVTVAASDYKKTTPTPIKNLAVSATPCKDNGKDVAFDGPNQHVTIAAASATSGQNQSNNQGCDQGSFTWFACPIISQLSGVITHLATTVLDPLLRVNTISPQSTPGVYAMWSNIRNFADVLFVLIFLAIVFSTVLQQDFFDQYTVKKTMPKLVAAAILVQFSFLISGLIVDIGNVLGSGIDTLLVGVTDPSTGPHSISNFLGQIGVVVGALAAGTGAFVALAAWEAVGPILLGLLLSVLLVLLTLGARYIAITVLIAISPLAFVAWVLPNTERYFKSWFQALVRLVMMYPIIIGVFSIAGRINELLGTSSGNVADSTAAGVLVAIVKPFIIIAAFLIVPKSFQWAGRALGMANEAFGKITGGAKSKYDKSTFAERGRMARHDRRVSTMKTLMNNDKIKGLTNSNSRIKKAAGRGFLSATALSLGGAPSSSAEVNRAFNNQRKAYYKEIEEIDDITPPQMGTALKAVFGETEDIRSKARRDLQVQNPSVLRYTQTLAGQAALVARANKANFLSDETLRMIHKSRPDLTQTLMAAAGKDNYNELRHLFNTDYKSPELIADEKELGTYFRNIKPDFMANKMNMGVMTAAMGKKVAGVDGRPDTYVRDARSASIARSWANNLETSVVDRFMDPSHRNAGAADQRRVFAQMVRANKDIFQGSDRGRAIIKAVQDHMGDAGNAAIYNDYFIHALGEDQTAVMSRWDPQNNDIHAQQMLDRIRRDLS